MQRLMPPRGYWFASGIQNWRIAASLALAACLSLGAISVRGEEPAAEPAEKPAAAADEAAAEAADSNSPRVEVVFVLDTTGSMSGLIHAAKEKIWAIANTLATAEQNPDIYMGLVAYRDRGEDYVTKLTPLTDDLDAVYGELMKYEARGGGDQPESVNQALDEAVSKIKWSTDDETYRVIFLVGDAPPHMDYDNDIKYPATCEKAAKAGIVLNTIQCGTIESTTPIWNRIAQLAEGQFFRVEQEGGAILATTPFDKDLAKLNAELDKTRLVYGNKRAQEALAERADRNRGLAAASSDAALARRAEYRSKKDGAAAPLPTGAVDLVEQARAGELKLGEAEAEKLPAELQNKTAEEQTAIVKEKSEQREKLLKQIAELSEKRQAYLRDRVKEEAAKGKVSLDDAIYKSIQKQSTKAGLEYKAGPAY